MQIEGVQVEAVQVEAVRPPIIVRRPALELTRELPHHWAENAFASHVFDALSSIFPDGEAFFVRSVRHYSDRIEDPQLQRDVQAFAAQEGRHSAEHDRHLALLLERYPAIGLRNRIMAKLLRWVQPRWPRLSLAATAGLEHLTALLARRILGETERWTGPMDPRMAPLWQWHALEEAEHKAVAFDVLQLVAPGYAMRIYALTTNVFGLFLETLHRALYMLWKDGLLWRRDTWRDGWRFLFGRDGLLRGAGPDYWAYYRRGFHPDQIDDRVLIEQWQIRFAEASGRGH